jgi:hypothetical protein
MKTPAAFLVCDKSILSRFTPALPRLGGWKIAPNVPGCQSPVDFETQLN